MKGDTYHKVRTQIAYVRFRIANAINPKMLLLLRKEEKALQLRLDMLKKSGAKSD